MWWSQDQPPSHQFHSRSLCWTNEMSARPHCYSETTWTQGSWVFGCAGQWRVAVGTQYEVAPETNAWSRAHVSCQSQCCQSLRLCCCRFYNHQSFYLLEQCEDSGLLTWGQKKELKWANTLPGTQHTQTHGSLLQACETGRCPSSHFLDVQACLGAQKWAQPDNYVIQSPCSSQHSL